MSGECHFHIVVFMRSFHEGHEINTAEYLVCLSLYILFETIKRIRNEFQPNLMLTVYTKGHRMNLRDFFIQIQFQPYFT